MDGFLPPGEVDDATWERVLAVNLTATMRATRAVLPLMLGAGRGAIVNVSSEAGFRASASGVAYAASKAAVNSLTRSTALFYRQQGIRCNAVAPGPVATSIEAPWLSSTRRPGARTDHAGHHPTDRSRGGTGGSDHVARIRRRQQRQRGRPRQRRRVVAL